MLMLKPNLGMLPSWGNLTTTTCLPDPARARTFVEETGVDSLAVAIGTAHGFYKKEPNLQFDLLSEIHEIIPNPLVLHGGSGIAAEKLHAAISRGICKINLATEIKNIFMKTLQAILKETKEIDLRKVFPLATEKVTELVETKLEIVKNEGIRDK